MLHSPFSPPTRGRGKQMLIGNGLMDLFRNSPLGWFQSSQSAAVQSSLQTPNTDQSQWLLAEGTSRLYQPTNQQESGEATGIPPEVHWCISLSEVRTSEESNEPMEERHQWRPASEKPNVDQQRDARWTNAKASSTLCWFPLILFPNVTGSLKHPLQKNITCHFTREIPENHHVCSQQNILS